MAKVELRPYMTSPAGRGPAERPFPSASGALDAAGGRSRGRRDGGLGWAARPAPEPEPGGGEQDQDEHDDQDHGAADQAPAVAPCRGRGRAGCHDRTLARSFGPRHPDADRTTARASGVGHPASVHRTGTVVRSAAPRLALVIQGLLTRSANPRVFAGLSVVVALELNRVA